MWWLGGHLAKAVEGTQTLGDCPGHVAKGTDQPAPGQAPGTAVAGVSEPMVTS